MSFVRAEGISQEQKNLKMEMPSRSWEMKKDPEIVFKPKSAISKARNFVWNVFHKDEEIDPQVSLKSSDGSVRSLERDKDFTVSDEETFALKIISTQDIKPGKYELEVVFRYAGVDYDFTQDFTWGVLAINPNKSVYAPDEIANLAMAVLDEKGGMVCDAKVELKIKNEKTGTEEILSTENKKIAVNPECRTKDFTLEPDYETSYQLKEEAMYELNLTAETKNGTYTITDRLEARNNIPFSVERITATRIYPFHKYPVAIIIKADEDFKGQIIETVPDSFEIRNPESETRNNHFEIQNSDDSISKKLVWEVDLKKGERYELKYEYQAPFTSPEFYLLGPLEMEDNSRTVFAETRQWQIASDASGEQLENPSFTGGSTSWTLSTATYSSTTYQDTAGSMQTYAGRRADVTGTATQDDYDDYNDSDTVTFSCYYSVDINGSGSAQFYAEIAEDSTPTNWTTIWSSSSYTSDLGWTSTGNVDVSSYFSTGTYRLRLRIAASGGTPAGSEAYGWFDNCSLSSVEAVNVTVSASGTQTANISADSTNQYVGGKFVIADNTGSRNVTGITIAEQGTVDAQNDLDNIKLYYENDTSSPYDCASESYGGTETQFGSTDTDGFSAANGTSAFTGSVGISTTSTMCVYAVMDIGSGASDGETLELEITDPSSDVTVSSGSIGPVGTAVAISGTTTLDVFEVSGSSDMRTGSTVRVAVDGTLDTSHTGTISATDGTWSVPLGTVSKGDSVIVFVEDSEGNESTAIAIYDGVGDIDGMVLDQNTLTIGSDDYQEILLSDLDDFQNSDNENVMHSVASSALTVDGGGSYTDETLKILAKNTLVVGGSETVNAHNIHIDTAGKLESKGNSTFNISGSLLGAGGSFAYATSTVNFTSSGDAEDISLGAGSIFLNDKVDKATGNYPFSVAIGDINNDGWFDLAVVNYGSNSVSILLNNGDGTFADKADKATGSNPFSVAIGDINNDGWADLAVTNGSGSSVSIFLNNGNGTFADGINETVGGDPRSVAIGDINNDGWADLAVANYFSNTVSILLNNGDGTFADKADKATGSNPYSVAIGDINNDGWADLAVANYGYSTVSTFLNNGDGTFADKVDKAAGSSPRSVAIGDLNNDGWADLAVVNYTSNTVSTFINNGDGTFANKVDKATGTNPFSVAIGDINNDGWADLAVANYASNTVSTFLNNGNGTFADKVDKTTGSNPRSVAIGDLNNDGWADLAVANYTSNTVSTFINNSDGTFADKVDKATGTNPYSVAIGDLDNDGWDDLAVANNSSSTVSTFINNGNGTFADKVDKITGNSPNSVAIGDLDNDGWADLAVANQVSSTVSIFINNGDGTFADKADKITGSGPYSVAIGDLNNDGWLDLATANSGSSTVSTFINNGDGTFADKADKAAGSNPRSVAIGDLDNDGWADLAVTNDASATVSTFLNNGDGTFADKVDKTAGTAPYSVAIGDLDNDGWNDLAVANQSSDTVSTFLNNGNGTFADKVDKITGSGPWSVAIRDLNNDGWLDLVTANRDSSTFSAFRNNGDGTFADKADKTAGTNPISVAIGDLNNDGWADLATANYNATSVSTFQNNGTNGKFNNLNIGSSGSGTWNLKTSVEVKENVSIANGTLAVNEDLTIFAGGNWSNSATFTPDIGTVEFTKTSGTQTLDSGGTGSGKSFNDLVHRGAGTLQLSTNAVNIDGDFTNYSGT
ncbi:MAG: VCBS repeat-containing protein, partial [Parcubacteria group bacterium]